MEVLADQLSKGKSAIDWTKLDAAHRPDELADEILRQVAIGSAKFVGIAEGI